MTNAFMGIAPLVKEVQIKDVTLQVRGISALVIVSAMQDFDEIRTAFEEVKAAAVAGGTKDVAGNVAASPVDLMPLFQKFPDLAARIGAGVMIEPKRKREKMEDWRRRFEEAEEAFSSWPITYQTKILEAALSLTFEEEGVRPLVERVLRALGGVGEVGRIAQEKGLVPNGVPASSGQQTEQSPTSLTEQDLLETPLHERFPEQHRMGTPPGRPGTLRPANSPPTTESPSNSDTSSSPSSQAL